MSPLSRRRVAAAVVVAALLTPATTPLTAGAAQPAQAQRPHPEAAVAGLRDGELLVKAAGGFRNRGLARALEAVNGRAVRGLGGGVSLIGVPPGTERQAAAELSARSDVAYAEPNYLRKAAAHTSAEVGWGVRRTHAPGLWHGTAPVTGNGVRVAVVDSGVDRTHPQLVGRVAKGRDLYRTGGRDDCGHGTAVAGVVAAAADGTSTVGVAPGATIVPVKVLQYDPFAGCVGNDAQIIEGLRWAADPQGGRADIINMSLSGPQQSSALRDAVRYATSQGVLVIAAAGNTGDREVQYPGAYRDVVSVGGIQRSKDSVRWWPSTSFAKVDIAAAAKDVPVITGEDADPLLIGRRCADRPDWCANGTSFAAPHVAGAAALLAEQHAGAGLTPRDRLRRLRQWLLATAPRVPARADGVDLKTGHGEVDATAASVASTQADTVLLTWQTGARMIAPTWRMSAPSSMTGTLIATTGTGAALSDRGVALRTETGGRVPDPHMRTGAHGQATTTLRSTAHGRVTRLTAETASMALPVAVYVLNRDDNTPGVRLPASPFTGSLNRAIDIDDVFRVYLRSSETLTAKLHGIRRGSEYADLFLHRSGTSDVTNPFLAPLAEPRPYDNMPQVLVRKVRSDGVRFLDVYGYGTYRLAWSIYSPGKVRDLSASPATITPDGDGRADSTKLSWRLRRGGTVVVRIRNSAGRVVRSADLGRESTGSRTWRWNGRSGDGSVISPGDYRAIVHWSDGKGRISRARTKITVRR